MDIIKIGEFIAELRKQHGLTQEQLGEKIGVTNKTVSRWETGVYMPPADALFKMSDIFKVTINEILSGRELSEDEYKETAEANLKEAIRESVFTQKEKLEFFKKKWLKDHIALLIIFSICILGIFLAGLLLKNSLISYTALPLAIILSTWRYNSMMAYAEKKTYGK